MQDWLNERGLDRKALQGLAANAAAVEEYEAYAYKEVQGCMLELLDLFSPPQEVCPCLTPHPTLHPCAELQLMFVVLRGRLLQLQSLHLWPPECI